jgi:hypothetical protein
MNWLTRLLDVPFVLLLSTSRQQAELEIAGKPAFASQTGDEVCIGLVLAAGTDMHAACLMLAAASDTITAHDALALMDGTPVLWRRYGSVAEVAATNSQRLRERMETHLALARCLRTSTGGRSRLTSPTAGQFA